MCGGLVSPRSSRGSCGGMLWPPGGDGASGCGVRLRLYVSFEHWVIIEMIGEGVWLSSAANGVAVAVPKIYI